MLRNTYPVILYFVLDGGHVNRASDDVIIVRIFKFRRQPHEDINKISVINLVHVG